MLINNSLGAKSIWKQVRSEYGNLNRFYSLLKNSQIFYGPGTSLEITDRKRQTSRLVIYVGSNRREPLIYVDGPEKVVKDLSQGKSLDSFREGVSRVISHGPMLKSQYERFSDFYDVKVKNILGNWELSNVSIFGSPDKENNLEGSVKIIAHFEINGSFPKLGDRLEESREQSTFFFSWKAEPEKDKNGWNGYYHFSPLLSRKFHSNSFIHEFIGEHIYEGIKKIRKNIKNPHDLAF